MKCVKCHFCTRFTFAFLRRNNELFQSLILNKIKVQKHSLHKNLFSSSFSRNQPEYGEIRSILIKLTINILSDTLENVISTQAFFNFCCFYLRFYLRYLYKHAYFLSKALSIEMWKSNIPFKCTVWVKS